MATPLPLLRKYRNKKEMEKKIYISPETEVIYFNVESMLLADSPLIFDGGTGKDGQGVPADEVIDL